MGRTLGKIIVAAIVAFVGAEVIKKKYPGLPKNLAKNSKKALDSVKNKAKKVSVSTSHAFKEGYASAKSI